MPDFLDRLIAANPEFEFGTCSFDCGWQLGLAVRKRGEEKAAYVRRIKLEFQAQHYEPPSAREALGRFALIEMPSLKAP